TVDRPPPEAFAAVAPGASAVRPWRIRRGLTARALAARAGVDPGYLCQIETGRKPGSVKALGALARALGVRLDDLVRGGLD
ncbi:MAG: helix-turn-helix domain-containing protein, partial [Alphaproteobacteria bacterium]